MKRSRVVIKFWLPVCGWMGFIFYLSSIPADNIPFLFPFQDIPLHLVKYTILSYLLARALKNTYTGLTSIEVVYLAVVFAAIYGLTDEFHQIFVPGRYASGLDLFVDGLGSLLGSTLYR